MKFVKDIPLSYMWLIRKFAGSPKTVLDLGCGDGNLMGVIYDPKWEMTGIDIHAESIKKAKKKGIYKKFIKGDLIKVCQRLIKQKKKYDLVFCSQVIEHIDKDKGEKLLDLADKLAKKRIYFGTPLGYMNQPEEFIQGNPYQLHRSGWSLKDFTKRGYRVYGVGLKPIWSEEGVARTQNKTLRLIYTIVGYLFAPVAYFIPSWAAGIMAVKVK